MKRVIVPVCVVALMAACGNGEVTEEAGNAELQVANTAPELTFTPGEKGASPGKVQSPIQVSYRVIGEPIVGQPAAIELRFSSALGAQNFDVSYRVNDSTALQFPETQAQKIAISPTIAEGARSMASQQVSVIPMREGRLFLNVAAQIQTESGSWSSVTAVPIQVGQAPRELLENGTVTTDETGELIRTLPGTEN